VLRVEPQRQFTVTPTPGTQTFEPFALPRVPVSLLAWCGTLAGMFREKHQRCLGCLLTLDPRQRRWTRAVVPSQRCEVRRSAIHVDAAGTSDVPAGCVVAGSSQSAVLAEPAEASWLVPAFDGLHVVDDLAGSEGDTSSHCFVRAGGVLFPVGPEAVVFDDWVAALRQHADRLTFE
jgi:hypothetical protein